MKRIHYKSQLLFLLLSININLFLVAEGFWFRDLSGASKTNGPQDLQDKLAPLSDVDVEYGEPMIALPVGQILDAMIQGKIDTPIVAAAEVAATLPDLHLIRDDIYMLEDKDYPKNLDENYPGVGQVSGIAVIPTGDVAIIHRSDREWNEKSFDENFRVQNFNKAQDNLIKNDTIMILDRITGGYVTTLGANLFYLPHGIASDNNGNLWVTDVGRHQVMRLPTSMLQVDDRTPKGRPTKRWLPGNLTRIWPDIILGEAFVPGNDHAHFCQPSEVAVSVDGRLVFVADGYCNRRVMVFSGTGKFITSFGENLGLNVVHSITINEARNLVCISDRENGRILCFKAGLDGDLQSIGQLMLSLDYPIGRVFALAAVTPDHMMVSSIRDNTTRFDVAALNPFTNELKQTWTPTDLSVAHSLAVSWNGLYVYVADMSKYAYRKVFKFNIVKHLI